MSRGFRTTALVALAVLLICSVAFATVQWAKVFKQTYNPKAGTALANAKCAVCHTKATGGTLNAYGTQLKGKAVTAASLKAVESADADKDGASNVAEIKAGTLPGNATSKPPSAPPKKKK